MVKKGPTRVPTPPNNDLRVAAATRGALVDPLWTFLNNARYFLPRLTTLPSRPVRASAIRCRNGCGTLRYFGQPPFWNEARWNSGGAGGCSPTSGPNLWTSPTSDPAQLWKTSGLLRSKSALGRGCRPASPAPPDLCRPRPPPPPRRSHNKVHWGHFGADFGPTDMGQSWSGAGRAGPRIGRRRGNLARVRHTSAISERRGPVIAPHLLDTSEQASRRWGEPPPPPIDLRAALPNLPSPPARGERGRRQPRSAARRATDRPTGPSELCRASSALFQRRRRRLRLRLRWRAEGSRAGVAKSEESNKTWFGSAQSARMVAELAFF